MGQTGWRGRDFAQRDKLTAAYAPDNNPQEFIMFVSIRARILATSVAIVVTALAVTGGLLYYVAQRHNDQMVDENLKSVLAGQALAIDEWITTRTKQVQTLADSIPIGDGNPSPMLHLVAKSGDFIAVTLGLPDKSAYSSVNLPAGYDPTGRPWYKQALATGHPLVTNAYIDAGTGKPTFSFVAPAMRDGSFKGAISAGVLLEGVSDIVSDIHPTPSSLAFLVDHEGNLLALANTSLLMKPATELAAELTRDKLASLQTADKPVPVTIGGATKLLLGRQIAGTDWSLVLALDQSDVTAGMHAIATTSLIAIIVVALIAAAVVGALTNVMFKRILLVRDALTDVASGSGDLSKRLPVTGEDEASQIAHAFNLFAQKVNAILLQIRESSASVSLASAEIAQGNQDLSSRTEHAASSLQETAAAVEEIAGTAHNSADAVRKVGELAESASSVAMQGGKVVSEVISTMNGITQASARIANIIGVIDGIAFQTNILALNAAVEAARANEHGRGFAVVAAEVRALAQRSAQAAKEIKELIQSSVQQIEAGSSLVNTAGLTMDQIVASVSGITGVIGEVTVAASEQSTGLGQVNQALSQLDNTTQQNAALVEQSAAAAAMLSEQVEVLAQAVGQFKLAAER
jgi:methyl-accepting chemotaxis protein